MGTQTGAAQAAQPQVGMSARGGFGDDGSYLMAEWFPVRVSLSNPAGAPSMRVRVEVDSVGDVNANGVVGSYGREVDLPSPSRKEVTLYASATNYARSLEVRLVQGSTVIKKATVQINPLEQPGDMIVGVVSSDASLLNVLKGERAGHLETPFTNQGQGSYGGPAPPNPQGGSTPSSAGARITIVHMSLQDIPTLPAALNSLGALVLEDVDTGAGALD